MKKIIVFLTFLLVLSGCQKKENTIYIGYLPSTRYEILSELMSQVIENQTSYHTEIVRGNKEDIASAEKLVHNGYIDLFISDKDTIEKYLLNANNYTTLLQLEPKVDTALILQKDVANFYGISTISDLAKVSKYYVFSAPKDFMKNEFNDLIKKYDLTFRKTSENEQENLLSQFKEKRIDVFPSSIANQAVYNLDAIILEDNLDFFEANVIQILGNNTTLEKYPNIEENLTKLANILDEKNFRYLNHAVEKDKKEIKIVVKEFLSKNNLLKVK